MKLKVVVDVVDKPVWPKGAVGDLSDCEIQSSNAPSLRWGGVCVGVWSPHTVLVITSLPLMQFQTHCA